MKMNIVALKLLPRGAPVIGFHRELPRSDTLLGALSWALADMGQDPVSVLGLNGSPRALTSSVFPLSKKGELLLPKPAYFPFCGKPVGKKEYAERKRIKKAKWITPQQMEEFLATGKLPARADDYPTPDMQVFERPRVAVPRVGGSTNLFHSTTVQVPGAWVAVWASEDSLPKILAAFRLLGEVGLGGEATYGFGSFEVERVEFPIANLAGEPKGWVSLSLYYPKPEEWRAIRSSQFEFLAYSIEVRKGRLARYGGDVFKPPVVYMTEGSVLPASGFDFPPGQHLKLPPFNPSVPHEVYVQGAALYLPGRFGK